MADISAIKLPDGVTYGVKDTTKQPLLVSGTNIKTINNESILGSGNISISAGGLQNLVDGSETGSVRGVGASADSSSYTIGTYAIAIGSGTKASGAYSFAEGLDTTASGPRAHAEGSGTIASGNNAHAEGEETTASNNNAHAEGYKTTASGQASHAEGNQTTASGFYSHAQNLGTIAQRAYQTAVGQYNIADTEGNAAKRGAYAVIVGNGTSNSARSNALTIDWDGNVDIASGAHYKINGTNLSASDVGAQPTLVSGTNIKMINNQSLLGSGNISISSGTQVQIVRW